MALISVSPPDANGLCSLGVSVDITKSATETARMVIARAKTAVLVEGYLDLIALAQAGVANVVATCGTAFTPDQARLLRRVARKVVVLFDGVCNLCNASVQWLLEHDREGRYRLASLQSAAAREVCLPH